MNNWNEISLPSYEVVEAPGEDIVQAWYSNDDPELLITKNSNGEFAVSNEDDEIIDGLATFKEATQAASNLRASIHKTSGFVSIPKSEWRDYLYLWDDGSDHEYKDVTSVNVTKDPDSGNFGDMGFATFKNGDSLIFNSHGSRIVHDVSAYEAERLMESGEGINA